MRLKALGTSRYESIVNEQTYSITRLNQHKYFLTSYYVIPKAFLDCMLLHQPRLFDIVYLLWILKNSLFSNNQNSITFLDFQSLMSTVEVLFLVFTFSFLMFFPITNINERWIVWFMKGVWIISQRTIHAFSWNGVGIFI